VTLPWGLELGGVSSVGGGKNQGPEISEQKERKGRDFPSSGGEGRPEATERTKSRGGKPEREEEIGHPYPRVRQGKKLGVPLPEVHLEKT